MSDDLLKRRHAPITDEAWKQIDDEAKRVLELHLAGRKFVDFDGPHGWAYGALNTGRLEHIKDKANTFVGTAIREVQPLVELRAPVTLPILELDYAARGAKDLDLDAVIATAEHVAHAEDSAIFYGYKPGRITGILEASPHKPVDVKNALDWPRALTAAKETLRQAGVNGPYALVASPDAYDEMIATGEDGYPLRKHIEENIINSPIIWAPALKTGALLVTTRGGDFELSVGQDLSVGYSGRDRETVELYITETFTFRVLEDRAAIFVRRSGK